MSTDKVNACFGRLRFSSALVTKRAAQKSSKPRLLIAQQLLVIITVGLHLGNAAVDRRVAATTVAFALFETIQLDLATPDFRAVDDTFWGENPRSIWLSGADVRI